MGDIPDVSVVMPCYNAERYIAEAIGSILTQGVKKIQIIVVDDGSTDNSAAIARGIDDRVECISQPNAGISAARNAAITRARGACLAFLDADDVWTPGSLAIRQEQLAQGNACVFGGVETFISPDVTGPDRERFGSMPPMAGRLPGSMLIRREAFDRVGLFDTDLKIGEMFDWVARAEVVGIVTSQIDQIVLRRRIHGANTSIRLKQDNREYLKALRMSLQRKRAATTQSGGAA